MNDMQNRYIDPETGKILDSAQSEVVGGIAGGLLGSGAINAVGQYNTYKDGLNAQAQLPGLIDETKAMLEKDQLDLELVDLAHQYKQNPDVLDQFAPESRELIRQDIDLLGRIHDRDKWDRINELPFRERAELFINGRKPSYDGYPHRVVEEMKGIYGPRPMHPEVPEFLREEIAAKTKDIDDLKRMMDVPVKYDWRAAAPSLDHYKPKNLWGTLTNPYVATGLFMGAMGGKVYDEYNKHKALIEQREMLAEKTAALKLPKLSMPKLKTPKNAPLIPKKVKRVGSLALGAGVLGYTGIKGTQQFREGSEFAERLKTQGMDAKKPDELVKERQEQMKVAYDTTNEGMDQHMKTAYEMYEELEKVAGIGSAFKKGVDDLTGKTVKAKQKLLDDANVMGDNEGVTSLLQKNLDYAKKDRNVARGVAGVAAGTGAAGAGVSVYRSGEEKTAFEKYEDLEKIAGIGNVIDKVKKTVSTAKGDQVKKWTAAHENAVSKGMGEKGLRATEQRLEQAVRDQSTARKQVGIAAGGLAVGGAGAAMAGKAIHDRKQEKTALELYDMLAKEAGLGNAIKKGVNHLTGKNVKFHQGMLEDSIKIGDGVGTIQSLQGNLDKAKKARNTARGVAGGTVLAGAAGAAGGMMAAKSNGQEKVAKEIDTEDSQYALDHPIKKTLKDGVGMGAMVGAPIGALSGAIAGGVQRGIPGALAGAAAGTLGGGLVGGASGAAITPQLMAPRHYANEKLNEGGNGATAGAIAGGVFGGLASGLTSAPAAVAGGRVAPVVASVAGNAAVGAGLGALIGSNQEKHFNNVHNGEFATHKQLAHQQGHDQVATLESDEIEKAASEVMNELFKEAASVIENDKMEKVAGIQSPISKINGSMFGYDRLK